jgi:hypothetical protein
VKNDTIPGFQTVLLSMKARSRIIIVCFDTKQHRRDFMIAANLNKMIGKDYVYLFVQTSATGFGNAKEKFIKFNNLRKSALLRFE